MGNVCLSCNIKEGLTDFNYAGFKVTEEYYSFPSRIKAPKIPGVRKKQFLCNSCVNTFDVVCSVHGVINKYDKFALGHPPRCFQCEEEFYQVRIYKICEI